MREILFKRPVIVKPSPLKPNPSSNSSKITDLFKNNNNLIPNTSTTNIIPISAPVPDVSIGTAYPNTTITEKLFTKDDAPVENIDNEEAVKTESTPIQVSTTAFTDISTLQTGNVFYVDSVAGDDSTGRPNLPSRPFKTIGRAVQILRNIGTVQTVWVLPGTYLETLNLLTNANYYFEAGAIVQNNSASVSLFSDSVTTAVTAIISGKYQIFTILYLNFTIPEKSVGNSILLRTGQKRHFGKSEKKIFDHLGIFVTKKFFQKSKTVFFVGPEQNGFCH
jgi:hypothetical protein